MSKFKIGDEVAIAAVVKITGIQIGKAGTVTYATDRGLCIPETFFIEIEKTPDRPSASEERGTCDLGGLTSDGCCSLVFKSCERSRFPFIREKCKAHRDYKEPQPAPMFNVGDRVATTLGNGTVLMTAEMSGNGDYLVAIDNYKYGHSGRPWSERIGVDCARGDCMWFNEKTLFPAPEPKYYSGKVFAAGSHYIELQGRDGCVFEIKNGYIPENLPVFNEMKVTRRVKTFKEFAEWFNATEWKEVKE